MSDNVDLPLYHIIANKKFTLMPSVQENYYKTNIVSLRKRELKDMRKQIDTRFYSEAEIKPEFVFNMKARKKEE